MSGTWVSWLGVILGGAALIWRIAEWWWRWREDRRWARMFREEVAARLRQVDEAASSRSLGAVPPAAIDQAVADLTAALDRLQRAEDGA